MISIRDYGALCDGITDDSAAIQAALDVGGSIDFGARTEPLTIICHNLTIRKNDTLLDLGMATLNIPALTPPKTFMFQTALGTHGTIISDGIIEMLPLPTVGFQIGIRIDGARSTQVLGTKIHNPWGAQGDGIWVGGRGGTVENGGSIDTTIMNVEITNPGRSCISASQVDHLRIISCNFSGAHGNPGAGLNIEGNPGDCSTNVTVLQSIFTDLNIGIYAQIGKGLMGADLLLFGNDISNCAKYGIVVNSIKNAVISSNKITGPGAVGLSVGAFVPDKLADNVSILNNLITGTTKGVVLAGVSGLYMAHNVIVGGRPEQVVLGVSGSSNITDNFPVP